MPSRYTVQGLASVENGEVRVGLFHGFWMHLTLGRARRALGGCLPPRGPPLALAGGHGRADAHVRAQRDQPPGPVGAGDDVLADLLRQAEHGTNNVAAGSYRDPVR